MESRRKVIDASRVWIVKVGSRVLSDPIGRLDREFIGELAKQIVHLVERDYQVVLVSSGAVASGVGQLGLPGRPADLATLQAVAAIGQAHLIQVYEQTFSAHQRHAAQVLLTARDLHDRLAYLNTRNTFHALLELGAIPIVNENDTVAVDELRTTFGDNDRLAAMVAGLFTDSLLVILSDVQGLYDRDPNDPEAKVLSEVEAIDENTEGLVRDRKTGVSKGGMASKLASARTITMNGQPVIIAGGRTPNVLPRILAGETLGTLFHPVPERRTSRKRWISGSIRCVGTLVIDDGAVQAIQAKGKSLLAIGIQEVRGDFSPGETVSVVSRNGREIARGLTNYSAQDIRKIQGKRSELIASTLGHCPYDEVIHRDNLSLT